MIDEKFLATLTLFYVEDDEKLRTKYGSFFKKLFKKVLIASDGLEALVKFNDAYKNNENIDIVISEIALPNFDGIELLTHVKKIDKNLPFIFASSSTKTEDLIESIKKGVSNYFTKPLDIFAILKEVEKVCSNKKEIDNNSVHINELEEYLNAINKVAIVLIFDNDGKIFYVNDFLLEVSKYSEEELLEQDYRFTYHNDISKSFLEKQWNDFQDNKNWKGKIKHLAKNNSIFYTNTTIMPISKNDKKENNKFISINFLTTEEENRKRNYKKKVLYNLQETKRVYKVAQDKIDNLRIEISKYEDVSKYEKELEEEKKISQEYYEEIKYYEDIIVKLDKKQRELTFGVNEKINKIFISTTEMIDVELKAKNKMKKVQEEIKTREVLLQRISNEIREQSLRIDDLEDVIEHRDNQIEDKK